MGFPVRTCSSPNSLMISVPDAGLLPSSLAADLFFEFGDDLGWESVRVNGKCLRQPDAGHLPMPGGGVLAGRVSGSFSEGCERLMGGRNVSQRRDVPETKFLQRRQAQRTGFGDVAKRVAADVTVISRIRQFADADAIQNDPNDAFEAGHCPSVNQWS